MNLRKSVVAASFAALCAGAAFGWNADLYEALPENAVLVDVDGKALTKLDLVAEVRLWSRLYKESRDIASLMLRNPEQALMRFEQETVLAAQAKREGVLVLNKEVSEEAQAIVRKSGNDRGQTPRTFIRNLGEDGKLLQGLARRRLVVRRFEAAVRAAVPPVTDADLRQEKANREAHNRQAAVRMATSWASGSNLWHRITASNDFDTCVAEYEQERDHIHGDPEWGCFTLDFFDDNPKLQKHLRNARAGEIFPLMEADNGLMIIKVVDITEDPTAAKAREAKRYKLASLFIAVPFMYDEQTDDQLRAEMLTQRQDAAWEKKVAEAKDAAKVTYPSGREFIDTRTPFKGRLRSLFK